MTRVGERIGAGTGADSPRYIAHPVVSSCWLQDARFIDAGSAQILDSNASHVSYESLRHGAWTLGPGSVIEGFSGKFTGAASAANRAYDDIDYEDPPIGTAPTDASRLIAWDYRTSHRFGPFAAIQDRPLDTGGYGPRSVKVSFDVQLDAASHMHLLAALTSTPAPPDLGALVLAVAAGTPAASTPIATTGRYLLSLDTPDSLPVSDTWVCRAEGDTSNTLVHVAQVYVWAGWYLSQGTGGVVALGCFEGR